MKIRKDINDKVAEIYRTLPTPVPANKSRYIGADREIWIANTEMCMLGVDDKDVISYIVPMKKTWIETSCDGALTLEEEALTNALFEVYDAGFIPKYVLRINSELFHGKTYLGTMHESLQYDEILLYVRGEWQRSYDAAPLKMEITKN